MKYGFIHIVIVALLVSACFVGCRVNRSAEKTETIREASEKTENYVDSSRTDSKGFEFGNLHFEDTDQYYLRITEYDIDGAVRRIQEKWGDRRSTNVADWNRQQESVSVTGSGKQIVEKDSSYAVIRETEHIQSDSRPVQGFEWFWVILFGALILSVVIFVIIKNNKKKWPQ